MQFQLSTLFILASTVLATPVVEKTTTVTAPAAAATTSSTTVLHGSMFGPAQYKIRKSTTTLTGPQATSALL